VLPTLIAAAHSEAQSQSLLPSKTYEYADLPVKVNESNHAESRHILEGTTHEGFPIEAHITLLPPGQMPHAPHHHEWEEILFIQTGRLEVTISGKTTHIGPGSVIYVASNEEHGLKNIGDVPAQYFVLAIGHHG
jgi:mannose-6-phosphate isomerase-like protein (cupin superfamily)